MSLGDPDEKSREPGVRVALQGGGDHVQFSQLRHFAGWVFWYRPNWPESFGKALMLQISKEIDDSDLWGRTPTILGVPKRNGYSAKAKKTTTYPQLCFSWSK